ncbi:condensin complex subunit 2 [Halictus rubicundus]|uniref:condensin complex subunit 2 n=1 Tax=Halictus rubicundus TaxID=77578 RepID=UPI00403577B2
MEGQQIKGNKLVDAAEFSTPAVLTPLRRKSFMVQQSNVRLSLLENDDEAERLARRREIDTKSTTAESTNDRRRSLGLSILSNKSSMEMVEHVSECIKLAAGNKINLKNAFGLKMIDFMTYMIKNRDSNMANLQMASMSLDVSTTIYGFRVDGIHMEILKMMGGLNKQDKDIENSRDNDAEPEVTNANNEVQTKEKTKKKRVKQQIFTPVESLRTNVQTAKPVLTNMESDLQTSDRLLQAMLPSHAGSGFYPHPYNDILVDTVMRTETQDTGVGDSIPIIKDISELKICSPMFHFDFLNFDVNEEPEDAEPEKINENTFQFDLNASLQDTRESYAGMDYADIGDNEDNEDNKNNEEENVDRCVKLPGQTENIVNFQQLLVNTAAFKPSEYSVVQQSLNIHWRGPSHWKPTNIRKVLGNSKIVEKCHQAPNKKKKELELCYDHETRESCVANFLPSTKVKIHTRTAKMEWNEEILTFPPDEHYDIAQASKLYLHPKILLGPSKNTDEMNTTHLSDIVENYDYNNENDTSSYCPQTNDNGYKETEENDGAVFTNDCIVPTQPLTGTNLVDMPTLASKTNIPYCVRAKKIDMKQLKQSIWKCLCTDSDKQDNESLQNSDKMNDTKNFNEIHKILPTLLTKSNAEALSFPISFVSLLHLANEKLLNITSSHDTSDLIIKQD